MFPEKACCQVATHCRGLFSKPGRSHENSFPMGVNAIPDGAKQFSQWVLKQYFYHSRGVKTENFRGPQRGGGGILNVIAHCN